MFVEILVACFNFSLDLIKCSFYFGLLRFYVLKVEDTLTQLKPISYNNPIPIDNCCRFFVPQNPASLKSSQNLYVLWVPGANNYRTRLAIRPDNCRAPVEFHVL